MSMNRRHFLRNSALAFGALNLSPLMRSVLAGIEARAAGATPTALRFVFCMRSSGLWAEMIQPRGLEHLLPFRLEYDENGRLAEAPNGEPRRRRTPAADLVMGDDIALSDVMQPLQPFADRISILQGINAGFSVYHLGHYQTLGGFAAKRRDTSEVGGQTIDSVLAEAFAAPVPHVCLGHDPRSPSGVAYITTSAQGPNKPMAFYTKPLRAYRELFGVIDRGDARKDYLAQSDILDFFAEDAKRLRSSVAAAEREQLDRYLNAFESVRESRHGIEAMSDQLKRFAPPMPGEIEAKQVMQIGEANVQIATASLLSGLTNVVTLQFDELNSTQYPDIGSMHAGIGHGQVKNMIEARRKICGFHFSQIARIARALQAVPEGDGTMLDNTLIIYMSDNGETHHSAGINFPIMLLGDLGGRLKRRRYFAPANEHNPDRSKPGYTRLGDVWATLLAAAGQRYSQFGRPINGAKHAPIESLLA